jgi:hypothetical protein
MVYRSSQNQLLRGRPSPRGSNRTIGEWRGLPLIERRKRRPTAGRVTSYRTPRNSSGFLRSAIGFSYDPTSSSVVIGPRRMQSRYSRTLNVLHERGGSQSQRLFLRYSGRAVPRQAAYGLRRTGDRSNLVYVGSFMEPRPRTANFVATSRSRTVRVPAGRYMMNGLDRVRAKIPSKFRNQIYGP